MDNLAETFFDSHDKRVGKVPESDEMEGLSHVRVLIAEDNIMSQKMLTRVLEKIGCRVDPVANGKEAVNIMEKIPYDLVFMDCQMPEMDGFDATRRIREMEGSSEHTPIIAMTAHAFREDRQRCIEAGMDDYISKPIAIEKLKTALKRWVVREETIVLAGRKEKNKPSKAPVFDHEGVLKRIGGDGDLLVSCMRDFLIDTPGQIEKLQEALFSEDETAIKNQAHKMKGAAGNMGVEQFKKQLISIERAAATEDLEKAGVVFNEVIIQFQALKEIMQGLIGKDAVGPRND